MRFDVCQQEEVVDSSLEFLILASDGLWDVVTNEVNTGTKTFSCESDSEF
jgi:serine/threonine protein phosphatase PrpC